MTVTSLKTARREDNPLRGELAAAIEAARAAREAVEQQRAAIARARELESETQRKLEAAKGAVTTAREEHARQLVGAAARGASLPTAGLVRVARAAETDMQDELEAVQAAVSELKADLPGLEEAARDVEIAREAAISSLFIAPAQALLSQAREMKSRLMPLRRVLQLLCVEEATRTTHADSFAATKREKPLTEIRATIRDFLQERESAARDDGHKDIPDLLQEVRQRLRADPYAVIDFAPPPNV